jgi:hypothetical protein
MLEQSEDDGRSIGEQVVDEFLTTVASISGYADIAARLRTRFIGSSISDKAIREALFPDTEL